MFFYSKFTHCQIHCKIFSRATFYTIFVKTQPCSRLAIKCVNISAETSQISVTVCFRDRVCAGSIPGDWPRAAVSPDRAADPSAEEEPQWLVGRRTTGETHGTVGKLAAVFYIQLITLY